MPDNEDATPGIESVQSPSGATDLIVAFALDAWRATPEMRIEDAYKWLLQATRGGEHAAPDVRTARDRLAREWRSLPAATDAEARTAPIEWLRHDGAFMRVHLASVKARGVDEAAVLEAFVDGVRGPRTNVAAFTMAWDALGAHGRTTPCGHLTFAEWQRLDAATRPFDFPAVHHSEPYRAAYAPAYRVMPRAAAERLLS